MLFRVLRRSQRVQVRGVVVQGVPVLVVNDPALGKRPVGSLPVDDGAQAPSVRFRHLDPSSRGTVLVIPKGDRPDRELVRRSAARFELGTRRKVHALGVRLAPRHNAGLEAELPAASVRPGLTVLCRATLRAALTSGCRRRLVFERGTAPLTRLFHTTSVSTAGLGTVPS
jgi:hypothetical protein